MWTLGKVPKQLIVLTWSEAKELADKARKQGYHAGNQAKNAAKRKGNETERLLAAIAPGVVLPNRNAATYSGSTESELPTSQFNVKESEMEDAA